MFVCSFVRLFVRRQGTFYTDIDSWIRRVNCVVFSKLCMYAVLSFILFRSNSHLAPSSSVHLQLSHCISHGDRFYKYPDLLMFNLLNGINKLHRRKKKSKQLTKNTCVFTMNSLPKIQWFKMFWIRRNVRKGAIILLQQSINQRRSIFP